MDKLEKVIKGLEHCGNGIKCETCPYHDENDPDEYSTSCNDLLCRDALDLLKEKQPKKGHWIEQEGFDGDSYYDCSVCGESWVLIDGTPKDNGMIYCPHCGARMDEPKDGEQE